MMSCATSNGAPLVFRDPRWPARELWPFGDTAFRNAHADWATRITNAINAQDFMWECEIEMFTQIHTIYSSTNFSTSTNCLTHLEAFTANHLHDSDIEAYQLYTGANLATCYGIAWTVLTGGVLASDADSVVEARDHSTTDSYDPANSNHLGTLSAQEISHNWGEPDHPTDFHGSKYNVMAGGDPRNWNDIGFWFTANSDSRIWSVTHHFPL